MGKRSNMPRIERDRYLTPLSSVLRLVSYLHRDGVRTFADLCDGGGEIGLADHLEGAGFRCLQRSDILTGTDALTIKRYVDGVDVGVTNPPFRHPEDPPRTTRLLRDLLQHFLDLDLPFWFLLPSDFSTNEYAASFLRRCTDIVVIGRVQWIPNSEHNGGKDNSCWYRFDVRHRGLTSFHNDRGGHAPALMATE